MNVSMFQAVKFGIGFTLGYMLVTVTVGALIEVLQAWLFQLPPL